MTNMIIMEELRSERPVFIFASGQRTGSTLLQRFLNSCPDTMIWGEHDGALRELRFCHKRLLDWQERFFLQREEFQDGVPDQFLPNMIPTKQEIIGAASSYLYALFGLSAARLGRPCWGFKEVRYGAPMAHFLQVCFPAARFIHLTRDVVDCLISMKRWELSEEYWLRDWTIQAIQDWQDINESFFGDGATGLSKLLSVRLEDMVGDPNAFVTQIANFLETPTNKFDVTVFDRKLHNTGEKGRTTRPVVTRNDLSESDRKLLNFPDLVNIARLYGYEIDI